MDEKRNELAPCGIYCGACPHYFRKCFGCSSDITEQIQKGKWACRIRKCCYGKQLTYCIECVEFPCPKFTQKLLDAHKDDPKYDFRHEAATNLRKMKEIGEKKYLLQNRNEWKCGNCGNRVVFFYYVCPVCKSIKLPSD